MLKPTTSNTHDHRITSSNSATEHPFKAVFNAGFTEANTLYKNDKNEEAIAKALKVLTDPSCTRYVRIKTWVLLGAATDDWFEAKRYHQDAFRLWVIVERWRPAGENKAFEAALQQCKAVIDDLGDALKEQAEWLFEGSSDSETEEDEDDDDDTEDEDEDNTQEQSISASATNNDEEADTQASETTDETSRELDISKAQHVEARTQSPGCSYLPC